ncbi:dual specificity protein phosphatase MPK-4 [Drosophila kikkawai]|uniref:Dual specificity protein phosphatase MPK-4 n=1 Tax=Drosophila kikkawai TaxID=30033 RepID=A0A6P4J1C1_DROKI|nr:dual specificity protein phosphatase MPK-4 [Drosophila kikkawai]
MAQYQPQARSSASCTTGGKPHDSGALTREDFDGGPVSIDEIETGLFLGNLTAATHMETLRSFKITHILTLDSVPLPQHILEASFLTTKYIQIADMPREDILQHLEGCVDFISSALTQKGNVLVHCYFGVSRSSSTVIAYMMKHHNLDFLPAYELVKAKRRFVQPNAGFVSQLKLFRRMGCKIDPSYQRYKIHRLRLAGEQMRKAKILPQSFHSVVRPDPDITRENPEPIVFRCRRCRRVLASKSHVLEHKPRDRPPQESSPPAPKEEMPNAQAQSENQSGPRMLEQLAERIRQSSLGSPGHEGAPNHCRSILFVEPIAWMHRIMLNTQGRLYCPKCEQKLGNFSWINACKCPCGETMTPAFYLIPSKVELSKAVQNVQTTV